MYTFECSLPRSLWKLEKEQAREQESGKYIYMYTFECSLFPRSLVPWLLLSLLSTGCLKLQVVFRKRATNYRALLRKMTYQ